MEKSVLQYCGSYSCLRCSHFPLVCGLGPRRIECYMRFKKTDYSTIITPIPEFNMCIICTSSEEELLELNDIDCSGCVTLKVIPPIPSLQYLVCTNCLLLTSIPLFPSLRYLYCSNCPSLLNIPLFPSLQYLDCSNCPLLTSIPILPSLQYLYCYSCPLLVNIPLIPSLQYLSCYKCPLLMNIPLIPSLQRLSCFNCPLLLNIPVASYYTDKSGCRWLNDLTLVTQVIICQQYIKSSHRGRLLSRALKDKSFVEWIYSPEVGGKYIKRRLLYELEK
jgi:hypothetical protein